MKKAIAILLAVLMMLTLFACKSNEKENKTSLKGTWTVSQMTMDGEPYENDDYSEIIVELYGDGVGLMTVPSIKDLFFPGFGTSTIVYTDDVFYIGGERYPYKYSGGAIKLDYESGDGTIRMELTRTSKTTETKHDASGHRKPVDSIIGTWTAKEGYYQGKHLNQSELESRVAAIRIELKKDGVGVMYYNNGFLSMTETLAYDGDTFTVMGDMIHYSYELDTIETTVHFGFDDGIELIFERD